ncbi:putative LPS assembly protein LptD [Fodinibius sp. Rm-B-1B1-1]|uniref:putative LPS assembly protein LptD n=1 Tax=Fodinibius alkaliphilus TaxID=3140241 RepID=UPI00315AA2DC
MNRSFKYFCIPWGLMLVLLLGLSQPIWAQDTTAVQDTLQERTIPEGRPGTQQSRQSASQPEQEGQVNFQANDSLTFDFENQRIATLYGDANVVHTSGELKAGKVAMNLDSSLVSAKTQTPQDTLSQPVLIRDDDRIRSNKIDFNYKTEKGRFEVARVGVQDGNLIGTKVKNESPHVVYLEDAIYSTCQLDHPHYYIQADRMKVVNEEEVFFERARLYILDIPYPLIFPFGYLPGKFEQKQSGLLEPTYAYQQRQTRGIGLQNFGWFQYFNDYLTGQASVDIFTSGSYYLDARTNYRIRNKLNGNIEIGYSRENSGLEPTDPDFSTNVQKKLSISHQQDFSPYSSFNTNINLRTKDFNQRNSYDPDERAETSTRSNLNYRYRHPEGTYNFDISINQNQNFATNVSSLSGPDMNFSLKRFSPFANEQTSGQDSKWYETISVRYQNTFNSDYEFRPTAGDSANVNWFEALLDPTKYREATDNNEHYQYGFQQDVSLSMNQLIPSRYLNVSANGNYTEYWVPTTTRKFFNADSNRVEERQVRGFTTARDFNTGLNFSTTLYGLMNTKIGKIQSIRHTLRPAISFSYQPDFSSDFWGYYRTVQSDSARTDGSIPTQKYSIFENEVFSGPGRGEQRSISFNLENIFEAKKIERDSTGEKKEEVIDIIQQFNLGTSYNFAADSLKLDDLKTSLRAPILPGLSIRANATFNFYDRDNQGNKIDDFLIKTDNKPFEMTSFSTSTSYSVQWGDGGFQANDKPYYPQSYNPLNQSIFHPIDPHFNRQPVQNFNSPLSFSIDFSYRWNLRSNPNTDNSTSATINARNINLKLTPKWDFRTQLGYDFVEGEMTPSQFSLSRNLHCWDLSFTMNPFGDNQYYFFSLRVNAGQLQSIFQKLPGLNNLERSSSNSGRRPTGF